MNNKPAAWITENALSVLEIPVFSQVTNILAVKPSQVDNFNVPLYIHPVKELTDEEIKEVWMNRPANTADGVIDFARAILRKAQEK